MSTTIAILGANGVYARHLIPHLTAANFKVRALVRRVEAAGVARACGADVRVADIFDAASLRDGLGGADVCINLATSLPGPSGRGDFAVNDRVRREGVPLLLEACANAGVQRLIQPSIAWIGASGDLLFDEMARTEPTGDDIASLATHAALSMEDAIRASALDWIILRGGLFYGPGTGFDDDWFARAIAGKLRLPEDGSDYVSLAHIADMCDATIAALKIWPSRQTLIVADDEPARWRDVFGYIAELAGAPPPAPGGRRGFPSFRASNAQARRVLNWAPRYSNFRMGLAR
jgi:nucleoside-diphosphate-sugar epimerase